jgi:hypothetical protein
VTIATMILLSAVVAAQKQPKGGAQPPAPAGLGSTSSIGIGGSLKGGAQPSGPTATTTGVNLATPKNKLVFPYGVQTFERREYLKVGSDVTSIPGWSLQASPTMVDAVITESAFGSTRPGTNSTRWLAIDDLGAGGAQGFRTPPIVAPSPWNYSWQFSLNIGQAPASAIDMPTLAIQHNGNGGPADAWGVRLTPTGAELFMTETWGETAQTAALWSYTGATDLGQWIDVRVVASLQKNTLVAFVNGDQVAQIRSRPAASTDVTNQRFAYHGGGIGNSASILLDDLGVAFLGGVCQESLNVDFTLEDDGDPLVNGQDISSPPEFGNKVSINGSGPNSGAAIFDSSSAGPNNPSQDMDLLLNQGNVLILQTDAATNPPAVAGIFPRPNDDDNGGTLQFDFARPLTPLGIDLLDVDSFPNEGVVLTLTDFSALTRTFTVPTDWTGDLTNAEPGVGNLDLQSLLPQVGWNSIATAVEDPGFDPNAVVGMTIELGGSGAVDNFTALIPCVLLTFDTEDDTTPVFAGTPLLNGQDISTPPEFGVEVSISDAGLNAGAAIFESTPGGANDGFGAPDKDLLVGLGNILILQNDLAATQTIPGFFNVPNDDTNGGSIFFDFPGEVRVNKIDLIDVDEEELVGVTVTLLDSNNLTRTFSVPISWTEDRLNDGPPAFRTLDLGTLAPQPGFLSVATAVEDPGFDADKVVKMTVDLGGAQAMDNICFCPQ